MKFTQVGTGSPLLMLHPGGTDARALEQLAALFAVDHKVTLPDQRGHGRTPDIDGPWSFRDMADETAEFVRREITADAPVDVFGYSDGAILGLTLAIEHAEVVRSLVFVSGVFHFDGWLPGTLDGDAPQFMADAYAEVTPDGADHWQVVAAKSASMHEVEPDYTVRDLAGIALPVLIIVGDDDEPRLDHILEMYRAIPNAELAVIPRATHGVGAEKPELVASLVREFHRDDRGNGYAPVRRAASSG